MKAETALRFPLHRYHAVALLLLCIVGAWAASGIVIPEPFSRSLSGTYPIKGFDWRFNGGHLRVADAEGKEYLLRLNNAAMSEIIHRGDQGAITFQGRLTFPSYKGYAQSLVAQGYHGVIYPYRIDFSELQGASWRLQAVGWIRERLLPAGQPLGALLVSVLGGIREYPPEYQSGFGYAGTAHLLAISGLHVGFIFLLGWLATGITPLSFRWRIVISLILPALYVWISGGSIPAFRAFLFLLFFAGGVLWRKHIDVLQCLFLSAIVSLLLWPQTIISASFHFSYGITAILILGGSLYKGRYLWICLLAMAGSIPLSAWYFGYINALSFLANAFAVPLFAAFVYCGVFALALPELLFPVLRMLHTLLQWCNEVVYVVPIRFTAWSAPLLILALIVARWKTLAWWRMGIVVTLIGIGAIQYSTTALRDDNRYYTLSYEPESDTLHFQHKIYRPENSVYAQKELLKHGIWRVANWDMAPEEKEQFRHIRKRETGL
ncbi:ComEC/Rec2 family competence protein [Chrysiogenes arsenatis]|uniref:ComEC/Rec2 family competence protein n=1 Tax=Chrysiogenes arsenatis TaxID=309797 RepID=UPI00041A1130|nr:ComEC/Rec2 family competence protein [Chrysiogenes arsenatis]